MPTTVAAVTWAVMGQILSCCKMIPLFSPYRLDLIEGSMVIFEEIYVCGADDKVPRWHVVF